MHQNGPPGQSRDQQPALPSYAEAIRTAPPPANFQYNHNVNVEESYQPSAPVYSSSTSQSMPTPYIDQSSYNPATISSPTACNYPTGYATNAYPQYGPNLGDSGISPATIHIIRPISSRPTSCCSGRSGHILAVILSIIILGAILRVTMNSYF